MSVSCSLAFRSARSSSAGWTHIDGRRGPGAVSDGEPQSSDTKLGRVGGKRTGLANSTGALRMRNTTHNRVVAGSNRPSAPAWALRSRGLLVAKDLHVQAIQYAVERLGRVAVNLWVDLRVDIHRG